MKNTTRTLLLFASCWLGILAATFAAESYLHHSAASANEPACTMCDGIFSPPEVACDGTTYVHFTTGGQPGTNFVVTAAGQSFFLQHGEPTYTISVEVSTPTFAVIFDDVVTGCVLMVEYEAPCLQPCEIYGFQAYQSCEDGAPTVRVSLGSDLSASSLVQVWMNDASLGTFAVGSFPRWFDLPFDIGQQVFFSLAAVNADCQAETDLTVVGCDDLCDNFAITDVFAEPDPFMPGWLGVSFTVSGGGGGIPIVMTNPVFPNDGSQTTWWNDPQSTALFVPVFPGTFATTLVFSTPFNNCSTTVTVAHGSITCGGLENIVYEGGCASANEYVVAIDIPGASADVLYTVLQNNAILGEFPGSAFPVTLSATPNTDNVWTLTVSILGTQCSQELTFQPANCSPACAITDVNIFSEGCTPSGAYAISIDFNSSTHEVFDIWNQTTGQRDTVLVTALPFIFPPVPLGVNVSDIRIAPLGLSGDCVVEETFAYFCPPPSDCGFTNLFAEAQACDGDQFMVDIQFDNPSAAADGFYIFGDGMIFGPFPYGQGTYTFGPLDGTLPAHSILVLDIADPSCFGSFALAHSCAGACAIAVVATPQPCDSDGETFDVIIDVSGTNTGGAFALVGNGVNYGTFNYADMPLVLEGFAGDGQSAYSFFAIDLDNPNCTAWATVDAQDCRPCTMSGLEYTVTCGPEGFGLTLDFEVENPASDQFDLYLNGVLYESFLYEDLPLVFDPVIPYELAGGDIRVVDGEELDCSTAEELVVPCCYLGPATSALSMLPCQDDGTYFLRVGELAHFNTSDTLLIDYAPAGGTIIQTLAVAYADLPMDIGPLQGNGTTNYIVVLRDSEGNCAQQATIQAVYCDNGACLELEGIEGVFSPAFGQDNDTTITIENDIRLSYQRHPATDCACNLFVTDGIPGVNFGNGHILATQNVGFGLHFGQVPAPFNTLNIDYYYTGGNITVRINNADAITVSNIIDLPSAIGPGVTLQVTPDPAQPGTGLLTFTGDAIDRLFLYTADNAAFDNICLSEDDNVWPGDTNTDNIAHHFDLLNIGIAYGATGPVRNSNTTEWTGQVSSNWGEFFADGVNFKHADANGDGVVNEADRAVLAQNYGLTHGEVTPFAALPYTELDPVIAVGEVPIPTGAVFNIPVVAGTAEQPIENIYGLAFTLQLDPAIFDMDALEVIYPTSWLGDPAANLTTIHRAYPDGRIEVALSRTDHNNVSGFGPIIYLRGIIDDIAGTPPPPQVPTELEVAQIMALDRVGAGIPLRPSKVGLLITSPQTAVSPSALAASFEIFPNPTGGRLYFSSLHPTPPTSIRLFNAAGQLLMEQENPGMELDLQALPTGVYMLQVYIQGQVLMRRVVRQ